MSNLNMVEYRKELEDRYKKIMYESVSFDKISHIKVGEDEYIFGQRSYNEHVNETDYAEAHERSGSNFVAVRLENEKLTEDTLFIQGRSSEAYWYEHVMRDIAETVPAQNNVSVKLYSGEMPIFHYYQAEDGYVDMSNPAVLTHMIKRGDLDSDEDKARKMCQRFLHVSDEENEAALRIYDKWTQYKIEQAEKAKQDEERRLQREEELRKEKEEKLARQQRVQRFGELRKIVERKRKLFGFYYKLRDRKLQKTLKEIKARESEAQRMRQQEEKLAKQKAEQERALLIKSKMDKFLHS